MGGIVQGLLIMITQQRSLGWVFPSQSPSQFVSDSLTPGIPLRHFAFGFGDVDANRNLREQFRRDNEQKPSCQGNRHVSFLYVCFFCSFVLYSFHFHFSFCSFFFLFPFLLLSLKQSIADTIFNCKYHLVKGLFVPGTQPVAQDAVLNQKHASCLPRAYLLPHPVR